MVILNKPQYFFQTKGFRIGLVIVGVVVVLGLVLFNKQLGQLLSLFGSKADTGESMVRLDGNAGSTNFLHSGYTADPQNSFEIVNGKLMLAEPQN